MKVVVAIDGGGDGCDNYGDGCSRAPRGILFFTVLIT